MITLDRESLLVRVEASMRFADVEVALARDDLTLDAGAWDGTIGDWLADGAPGARSAWLDPADHLIAGFTSRTKKGDAFEIRPAPRRAVGPDLLALILGVRHELLVLDTVWLRVHRRGVARPSTEPFTDDNEPLTNDERTLYAAIRDAL